jgi:DNA-binding transcriptional LysR family regulator
MQVMDGGELLQHLDWGDLDAVITTFPVQSAEYWSLPIVTQRMGIALLEVTSSITEVRLLLRTFLISPLYRCPGNFTLQILMQSRAGSRNSARRSTSWLMNPAWPNVLARVAVGQGVALVAMGFRGDETSPVSIVRLDDPELSKTWIYAAARFDNLHRATREFIRSLADSCVS